MSPKRGFSGFLCSSVSAHFSILSFHTALFGFFSRSLCWSLSTQSFGPAHPKRLDTMGKGSTWLLKNSARARQSKQSSAGILQSWPHREKGRWQRNKEEKKCLNQVCTAILCFPHAIFSSHILYFYPFFSLYFYPFLSLSFYPFHILYFYPSHILYFYPFLNLYFYPSHILYFYPFHSLYIFTLYIY